MRGFFCLLAFALATPAAAQDALTADEELQCAVLAAVASSQSKASITDPGLASIMSYWFGRYEARTGKSINDAVTLQFLEKLPAAIGTLAPRCEAEAKKVGARMQALGEEMQRLGRGMDRK